MIAGNFYKNPKYIKVAGTLDTKCGSIPGFTANYVIEEQEK